MVDASSDVISPWGSPRQRAAQRRNKRDALLATAAKRFKEQGFASTSLEQIAAQLGITKPTLYYYVRSKSELVHACAMHGWSNALHAVQRALATDPSVRLLQVLKAYAKAVATDAGWCMVRVSEYAQPLALRKAIAEQRKTLEACVASAAASVLPAAVILRALEGVVLSLPQSQWERAMAVLAAPCCEPLNTAQIPQETVAAPEPALKEATQEVSNFSEEMDGECDGVVKIVPEPEPEPEYTVFELNISENQWLADQIPTHQKPEDGSVKKEKKRRSKPTKQIEQISLF